MPEHNSDGDLCTSTHIVSFLKWPYTDNDFNLQHEIIRPTITLVTVMSELDMLPSEANTPFVDCLARHRLPCGCTSDLFSVVGPGLQLFDDPARGV